MIEPSRLPASIVYSIRAIGGWFLLSALFFLTGCNPGGSSTAYVPYSVAPPASLGAKKTEDSPIEDSVSYWEGDSVTGPARIVIDVSDQRAYFYKGSQLVGVSKVSSGRDGFDTPQGDFKIIQKNKDHRSNLYGNYLWPNGEIAMKDIDVTKDKKPAGSRFEGSSMPYFMRFANGVGMHGGYLPGFAASHGCVRMPTHMAATFFRNVEAGTPVTVRP
ncbi:MAG: L,D-transpeptidase family protein [Verrucomicrobia bacterium]|nr:L,D-transpeptidase family protein [Verrucomicrobiota bacterium]